MRRQLAELDDLVKAGDGRARRRKNITAKDVYKRQRQLYDRYEQRRGALNTMQDVMHEFGQRMRGTCLLYTSRCV